MLKQSKFTNCSSPLISVIWLSENPSIFDFFTVFWIMKEEKLCNLGGFPQNSEFLNLNHFECEKKLKLCYVQAQMFEFVYV